MNKRFAWWISFSFLLGIFACCISAFITLNRFGFALEGAICAADRIYYDSINGQLKEERPKWEGFNNITNILDYFQNFLDKVNNSNYFEKLISKNNNGKICYISDDHKNQMNILYTNNLNNENEINELILPYSIRYEKIALSLCRLKKVVDSKENLVNLKEFFEKNNLKDSMPNFFEEFHYYADKGKICSKILGMIYFSFLLIVVFFSGVSMVIYVCLKRQSYLLLIMNVLWNIIRFFIFSFFLYGTAYGIIFLILKDIIAYIKYVFSDNLKDKNKLFPDGNAKQFLTRCLLNNNTNYKNDLNDILQISLNDFFTNYKELINLNTIETIKNNYNEVNEMINYMKGNISNVYFDICDNTTLELSKCNDLSERAIDKGGLFGSFDCGFLKSDLQHLYRTIYDASVESRILSALSLCSAFFGEIVIYFLLLVMHHYNNEFFLDNGKNIFSGLKGFNKRNKYPFRATDPGYKKRKMKAEIELTSANDDNSANKNIDKKNYL